MGGNVGIEVIGTSGGAPNDWDQWDSSVVLHELFHYFQNDTAEIPPNSGGTHIFTEPPTTSGADDLALAFCEGLGNFFSCYIQEKSLFVNYKIPIPDTLFYWDLELPRPDAPYYKYYNQINPSSVSPLYEGEHIEGAISLSIMDLYDLMNDGNYLISGNIWGHNNDYNSAEWWNGWDPIFDVLTNFDPQPNNPDHNYCWNIHEFIHGWRTLGYPIDSTFKNIFEAHNVPVFNPGDANDNELINILDVTFITNYLYGGGTAPNHLSAADANSDCAVNLLDATYLINYLYKGGSAPLAGCYNYYPN
ncbi:MAG: dockerin type I domain-containing protein [Candidatus Zixiibacteriota bacterium]